MTSGVEPYMCVCVWISRRLTLQLRHVGVTILIVKVTPATDRVRIARPARMVATLVVVMMVRGRRKLMVVQGVKVVHGESHRRGRCRRQHIGQLVLQQPFRALLVHLVNPGHAGQLNEEIYGTRENRTH